MLRKLLKFDMNAVWRIWIWIAVAAPLAALLGGFCLRFLTHTAESDANLLLLRILTVFGVIISFFTIGALLIVTLILVYWRFYKNFFSDEGYLTFTLPVSRAKHLLSKTLNACIWLTASACVILLCIAEISLIVSPATLKAFCVGIGELYADMGAWGVLYTSELLVLIAAYLWVSVGLVQLCITIGSIIAKKHKILAAIGIYYLVNTVLGFVVEVIMILGIFSAGGAIDDVMARVSTAEAPALIALVLLIAAVILSTVAYLIHIITLDKLERRLNLA